MEASLWTARSKIITDYCKNIDNLLGVVKRFKKITILNGDAHLIYANALKKIAVSQKLKPRKAPIKNYLTWCKSRKQSTITLSWNLKLKIFFRQFFFIYFIYLQLVSGSSGTEQTDEKANGAETDVGKGDGYTEGIPGPVTRLFVLANRGLSNLIQDLILVSRRR